MESLSLIAAGLTLNAPTFGEDALGVTYFEWLSNSMLVAAIVVLVVLWWARSATQKYAAGSRRYPEHLRSCRRVPLRHARGDCGQAHGLDVPSACSRRSLSSFSLPTGLASCQESDPSDGGTTFPITALRCRAPCCDRRLRIST